LKRQVDWLVNGSLTGPIFSRVLNQLTQLEIFPARDKDWPVMSVITFNQGKGLLACYRRPMTTTINVPGLAAGRVPGLASSNSAVGK
jgi:hypothetical protein